ncbi:MAG: GNAT family N-acetyltransferase [bacterium]
MKKFPLLKTERLVLRELKVSDAPSIFDIFSRERVTKFISAKTIYSLKEAKKMIRYRKNRFKTMQGIQWAITLREKQECVIGSCGYNTPHQFFHYSNIGYELHPDYWHKGIMTEALTAIINYGFSEWFFYYLNRIEALTYINSVASITLLKKLGFKEEGIRREYGYWKNKFHDLRSFSLLRRDWKTQLCGQKGNV